MLHISGDSELRSENKNVYQSLRKIIIDHNSSKNCGDLLRKSKVIAENGFDPLPSGLWARRASAAPLSCGWRTDAASWRHLAANKIDTTDQLRCMCWATCVKSTVASLNCNVTSVACWIACLLRMLHSKRGHMLTSSLQTFRLLHDATNIARVEV